MPTKRNSKKTIPTKKLLGLLCQALDEKKAEDIVVLDVSGQSSITNYLVLATGNSEPHIRALRNELERVIDESKTQVVGVDASPGSGWSVVDVFDVMVHVFTPESRGRFRLENLWGDAVALDLKPLLTRRSPRKKTSVA